MCNTLYAKIIFLQVSCCKLFCTAVNIRNVCFIVSHLGVYVTSQMHREERLELMKFFACCSVNCTPKDFLFYVWYCFQLLSLRIIE